MSIKFLCQSASVSRSGYYNWLKIKKSIERGENQREITDQRDFDLILEAFRYRGYDKGRRGIHMRLLHQGILMNEKKISRLMKKYNLVCPIRKSNPYRRIAKAIKSSNYAENLLNREFEDHGPGTILLTDITYLFYGSKRSKAYLSVIKDAFTKQILAYVLSKTLEVDFVLETVQQLFDKHQSLIKTDALINSDQGCHYTSIKFIELVKDKKLRQSMSRRGNCWDNAPQESFFGHMKDEVNLNEYESFDELKTGIDDYMDYYNNDRYQYQLAKLSPNQFLEYFNTGIYPLAKLINEPQNNNLIKMKPKVK